MGRVSSWQILRGRGEWIRRSKVSVTDPSRLFSMGTMPWSAMPVSTALTTAVMLLMGMSCALGSYRRAASSLKVPGGPR